MQSRPMNMIIVAGTRITAMMAHPITDSKNLLNRSRMVYCPGYDSSALPEGVLGILEPDFHHVGDPFQLARRFMRCYQA